MLDVPSDTGKMSARDCIDMTFFGFHRRICEVTDPHQRIGLELSYSAIIDSGNNPNDLWGSDTAVITASVTSETEYDCLMDVMNVGLAIQGHSRSMQANRISYYLNLRGPSLMVDGSWNGSVDGLSYAADLISRGSVRAALVVSCNLLYSDEVSYHYHRMGRLTLNGRTRSLADNADGYNRSEGSVAFFLQRKEDAVRSYGSPVAVSSMFQGSKNELFPVLSEGMVKSFFTDFYQRTHVDPNQIAYVETAGVASRVMDAAELNGMAEVLVKGREKPLLVGCVKSNLGHTEAASGSVAIAKALIAMNTGIIPPNLHYNKPNSLVPYLSNGQIQVVNEATSLDGDMVGVNNVSSTAGLGHTIIKRHQKQKTRRPEKYVLPPDGLPRLLLISGRTEEGLNEALSKIEKWPIDEEFVALTNRAFKRGIKKHLYRGYTVLNDKMKVNRNIKQYYCGGQPPLPVWWVFTGMGSQWPRMGVELMSIPICKKSIYNCHDILKPKGVDLLQIITSSDPTIFDNILHSFVGIAAIQIALVDVLREVGVPADGLIGHSVGELGCAYADGCFTAEQMILAAYARGKASTETELIHGMMAAVGLGYNQIKDDLPEGIEVACHNSVDSCTLSGPADQMKLYITSLTEKGVFAKLVNVSNIAYHSKYIKPAAPALLAYLKQVVPKPKQRSAKWISTSVPEKFWNTDEAQYCSAEYHTNNLLGSVLFEEGARHMPKECVIIEIAPHGLLQAILKRSFPNASHVPLTKRTAPNGLIFLFSALGTLYTEGITIDIEKLYPPVEFPVSCGTPSMNDLAVLDHSESWTMNLEHTMDDCESESLKGIVKTRFFTLDLSKENNSYIKDYSVYDKTLIPIAYYLDILITDYQKIQRSKAAVLQIINIKLVKQIDIEEKCELLISPGRGSGKWEISRGSEQVFIGEISLGPTRLKLEEGIEAEGLHMTSEEIYFRFCMMGYSLGQSFRLIRSAIISESDISAFILWNGNLVTFMENVLNIPNLSMIFEDRVRLPTRITKLTIDITKFPTDQTKVLLVTYNEFSKQLKCEGMEVLYPSFGVVEDTCHPFHRLVCEELHFKPLDLTPRHHEMTIRDLLHLSIKIMFSNINENYKTNSKLSVIEVQDEINLHEELYDILKWRNEIKTRMIVAATDDSLQGFFVDHYCLIVTGSSEMTNSENIVNEARGGMIFMKSNKPPRNYAIVLEKKINNETYILCKPKRKFGVNCLHVFMENDEWIIKLQDKLNQYTNDIIYMVVKETSLDVIHNIIRKCNQLEKSQNLRFIFLDYDIEKFEPNLYKEQLDKDLRVNILRNNVWGIIMNQKVPLALKEDVSTNFIYKFLDIRCESALRPEVLGLNLTDVSNVIKQLEVLDYSGINGQEEICGIGRVSARSRTLHPDPVLRWTKPSGWTHEQVATVLVPYALAYYLIKIGSTMKFRAFSKSSSILVLNGVLPLSQAVITVSLANNMTVYTTYYDEQDKINILNMFPQIAEENVISNVNFDIAILQKTKTGVPIIVNTVPEYQALQCSVQSLEYEGTLYQVSQAVSANEENIGLFILLSHTCIEGVNPKIILDLDSDTKKELQRCIEEGFKDGVIRPLDNTLISSSLSNIEALHVLSDKSLISKKVIVPVRNSGDGHDDSVYRCPALSSYFILGDSDGFWLDLIEWLIKRGARNIYFGTNKEILTKFAKERLRKIRKENIHLNLIEYPESTLNNCNAINKIICEINKTAKLQSMIIVGEVFKRYIEDICNVLNNEKVILFSHDPEMICKKRLEPHHNILGVLVKKGFLTPYKVLGLMDKLMNLSKGIIYVLEKNCNNSLEVDTECTSFLEHLPCCLNELYTAEDGSACYWQEVRTSSPPYRQCYEVPPVFLLPPLKRNQMAPLVTSLFFPTFIAQFPKSINSFESLIQQLYEDLDRFQTDVFTLICSDWSWFIGVTLAKQLEKSGKTVSIIFFESSITDDPVVAFQQISSMVNKESINKHLTMKEIERHSIKRKIGLEKVKTLLNLLNEEMPSSAIKIKGICHYIRPNTAFKENKISKIQSHCEKKLNIYVSGAISFSKMITDTNVIKHINTLVIIEYKDAARKPDKIYVEGSIFQNPRRSYLKFLEKIVTGKTGQV